jgi:hypothetical protein
LRERVDGPLAPDEEPKMANVTPPGALPVTARVHQLIRGQCDGATVAAVLEDVAALERQLRDAHLTLASVRAGRDLLAASNLELVGERDALVEQLGWARRHLSALGVEPEQAGEGDLR